MVTNKRSDIIDMLVNSFSKNERIASILRSSQPKHLRKLFNYVYRIVDHIGEVYISPQASNVILYFQNSKKSQSLQSLVALLQLLLSINWKKIKATLYINKSIKSIRERAAKASNIQDYIYIWFLASADKSGGYAGLLHIKNHIREISQKSRLPIFIETTVPRMVPIYQKAGFMFYETKKVGTLNVWFAKYDSNEK